MLSKSFQSKILNDVEQLPTYKLLWSNQKLFFFISIIFLIGMKRTFSLGQNQSLYLKRITLNLTRNIPAFFCRAKLEKRCWVFEKQFFVQNGVHEIKSLLGFRFRILCSIKIWINYKFLKDNYPNMFLLDLVIVSHLLNKGVYISKIHVE